MIVYPYTRSVVDPTGFVSVWNDGTPEYDGSEMQGYVEQLPFEEMLQYFVYDNPLPVDKRGNYQIGLGLAGGQSHQPRTKEKAEQYYGVAMPSVLKETSNYISVMRILSKICHCCDVEWSKPAFRDGNPLFREYFKQLEAMLGEGIDIALVTWAALPLDAWVAAHRDGQNPDYPLSEVVLVQKIVLDREGR